MSTSTRRPWPREELDGVGDHRLALVERRLQRLGHVVLGALGDDAHGRRAGLDEVAQRGVVVDLAARPAGRAEGDERARRQVAARWRRGRRTRCPSGWRPASRPRCSARRACRAARRCAACPRPSPRRPRPAGRRAGSCRRPRRTGVARSMFCAPMFERSGPAPRTEEAARRAASACTRRGHVHYANDDDRGGACRVGEITAPFNRVGGTSTRRRSMRRRGADRHGGRPAPRRPHHVWATLCMNGG